MHENSKLLFARYGKQFFRSKSHVLEIGPDAFPSSYKKIVDDETITWETVDISNGKNLTYSKATEYSFPVPSDFYEVVVAGQVIEHVRKIWVWVKELERVCKTGGYVILINPVSWVFHEAPVDCWRIYPEGMKALLEDTGLHVIESRFESLEAPGYKKYSPEVSADFQRPKLRFFYRLAGLVGFPVQRAYDTITIARKQ